MNLSFVVYGPPVPKARARVVKGRAYTPKRTRAYEKLVTTMAMVAEYRYSNHVMGGRVAGARKDPWPKDAKYSVSILVYRKAMRGDADNFAKSIMDALNGIIWNDDRQVQKMVVEMFTNRLRPRVEVSVEVLCG